MESENLTYTDLFTINSQELSDFIQREALSETYLQDAQQWILPLVPQLIDCRRQRRSQPLILGINGAQGTGKSTMAGLLQLVVGKAGLNTVSLSIDDFYLSKARRRELADKVHPLLHTRGVPGTHDIELALSTISALCEAQAGDRIPLPSFDKANDDCRPFEDWPHAPGAVDIIILEGWCVGIKPQSAAELREPVNDLERNEDPEGVWRNYVNQSLAGQYQALYSCLDKLWFLKVPDFEQVLEWRHLQEQKLRHSGIKKATALMTRVEINKFIQYFERLTRHSLASLADSADIIFLLDTDHRITNRIVRGD